MDLRSLIKLAPALFRGPLLSLLERIEGVELAASRQTQVILGLNEQLQQLRAELEKLRQSCPPSTRT